MSLQHRDAGREPLAELSGFRGEFYSCLTARSDALSELADAVLCGDAPVRSLAELSLVGEHRRGHGGLYAALAQGRVDADRPRQALASVPLPRGSRRPAGPGRRRHLLAAAGRPHLAASDPVPG